MARRNLGISCEVQFEAPVAEVIEAEALAELIVAASAGASGGGGRGGAGRGTGEEEEDAMMLGLNDGAEPGAPGHRKELIVIDTRDADHAGGHIKGAISIPYDKVKAHLPQLVAQHGKGKVLVVYCMYSKERGPQAAADLLLALSNEGGDASERSDVYVLRGGFHHWLNNWLDDAEDCEAFIENYEPDLWRFESEKMQLVHTCDHPDTSLDVAIRRLSSEGIPGAEV